jgi:hypothetical protein
MISLGSPEYCTLLMIASPCERAAGSHVTVGNIGLEDDHVL